MAPLPVGQGSKEPARGGVLGVSSATSFFLEFPLLTQSRQNQEKITAKTNTNLSLNRANFRIGNQKRKRKPGQELDEIYIFIPADLAVLFLVDVLNNATRRSVCCISMYFCLE